MNGLVPDIWRFKNVSYNSNNRHHHEVLLFADKSARLQVSLAEAGRVLREKFNVYECTIQMERYVDEMLQCSQCQEDCG